MKGIEFEIDGWVHKANQKQQCQGEGQSKRTDKQWAEYRLCPDGGKEKMDVLSMVDRFQVDGWQSHVHMA